jgi:alkylation response protein AidB-like acyl-CoA dehydrogenase
VDFRLSEEQEAIRELAARIFAERTSHERLAQLEKSGEWHDRELWHELARASLTALLVPAELGGGGSGLFEACLVLEEAGRHLAPVPLHATLLLGSLPIVRFGSPEQKRRWLDPLAQGAVLTAALDEEGLADPARPRTSARRDGAGWRLDGVKIAVPGAQLAARILVPARTGEDTVGVFALEPGAAGIKLERQVVTNREPRGRLELDGARAAGDTVLGDPHAGAEIVSWTLERAAAGLCAMQLGVCAEALRRTADYITGRKQFGRQIATFQGAQLRAADAFIDLEAMRATLWQAAWRLAEGRPAAREIAAATWWACRGGHRVVHTAQHLHGGIGADVEYPIHRYMLWAKQIEVTLGGASRTLARLGRLVALGEPAGSRP